MADIRSLFGMAPQGYPDAASLFGVSQGQPAPNWWEPRTPEPPPEDDTKLTHEQLTRKIMEMMAAKGKPWPRDFDKNFRESKNVLVGPPPFDPTMTARLYSDQPGAERLDPQMRADIEAAAMRDRAIMRQSVKPLPAALPPGYRPPGM